MNCGDLAFACVQLPVSSNLFDQFGGGGGGGASGVSGAMGSGGPGTVVIPQMSASCPSNMKEEQRTGEQGYLGEAAVLSERDMVRGVVREGSGDQ